MYKEKEKERNKNMKYEVIDKEGKLVLLTSSKRQKKNSVWLLLAVLRFVGRRLLKN